MKNALKRLSARDFENLVYDLMVLLGLRNATWRTPGRDEGRDIEGDYFVSDISGYHGRQKWYIECEKYASAVSWPTVRDKLSYAEAHSADSLLFVTTSSMSPQCVDQVNRWNAANSRPQVRHWGGHELVTMLTHFLTLLVKYRLAPLLPDTGSRSVLGLSMLALKYVHSAQAASVFSVDVAAYLESAAALSDLITRKIGQIEVDGRTFSEAFSEERDSYPWLGVSGRLLHTYDRYVLRALLAVIRQLANADKVEVRMTGNGRLQILTEPPFTSQTSTQESDLISIALWDNIELRCEVGTVVIIQRPET